jgi:hypothetical protein
MSETPSLPSDEALRHLQEQMLKAVITRQPLPNSSRPLNFPDLSFIMAHPNIYLSNENLFGSISVEGLPKPLRILSPEELSQEARAQGDIAYLLFRPPDKESHSVRLTLEGRIAPRDPQQRVLGLSGVQMTFRQDGDQWKPDEPVMFAS